MKIKNWISIFLAVLILSFAPILAYAEDNIQPVEKVTVHFWMIGSQGEWTRAQGDWIAVEGGSKKMSVYNTPAQQNSPLSVGDVTYTFNNSWIDDFGNTYPAKDVRLYGSDFIALFKDKPGPTAELNVYGQYTAEKDYYFNGTWTDNVGTGGGSESHVVNATTGYTHIFKTPSDIPEKYSFLYWDGEEEYGHAVEGSVLEIPAGSLSEDLNVEFIATYNYTPTSLVKVIYKVNEEIIYETPTSADPINIRENAPVLENGQWLFNMCGCVGEEAVPGIVDPIVTTTLIEDKPIIKTVTVYGVLNGIDGKDGTDGADGKDGIDGKNGADGKNGIDGKDGVNGKDGKDGIDGINGKDGVDGVNGKDGANGIDGKDGVNGINGADGKDGVNGKDGANGETGSQGVKGDTGAQGPQGLPGITTTNENLTVKYTQAPSSSISRLINPIVTAENIAENAGIYRSAKPSTSEIIDDEGNPLASGLEENTSHWGLLNLIFMVISFIGIFIPIIFRRKNTENYNKIIIAILAIAAIIVFVLTENILLPMAIVDSWTWLMAMICIGSVVFVITSYFIKKEDEQEVVYN